MGYTHYFTIKNNADKKAFNKASKICAQFINDEKIVSYTGEQNTTPDYTDKEISFNGADGFGYESFCAYLNDNESQFVKTNHKYYDVYVVATLTILKHFLSGDIDVSSDGDSDELKDGFELAQKWIDEKQSKAKKAKIKLDKNIWGIKEDEPTNEDDTPPVKSHLTDVIKELTDNVLSMHKPEQIEDEPTEQPAEQRTQDIKRSTVDIILRAMNASSKDETRKNLNGVNVRRAETKGEIYIEAVNGHIAFRKKVEDFGAYNQVEESIIISNEKRTLTNLKFILKEYASTEYPFQVNDHDVLIAGEKLRTVAREFVKLDMVIPKYKDDDVTTVTLNADYIMQLAKTIETNGRAPKKLTFRINKDNNLKPVVINQNDDDVLIIMPIAS